MSSTLNGDFKSPYGIVHLRYPGPFALYDNAEVYHQTKDRTIILQRPALRAFKAAEARCATPKKPHILITGQGYRSYDAQKALWLSVKNTPDEGRYADPDESMHVEADAVDVAQDQGEKKLAAIHRALIAEGWFQSVSGEPWHYSFRKPG